MKKIQIILIYMLIAMMLASCSNKKDSKPSATNPANQPMVTTGTDHIANQQTPTTDTTSEEGKLTLVKDQEPYYFLINNIESLFPGKKAIYWVMPSPVMANITEQHIIDFNNKLISDANTDYVLQFVLANSFYDYSLVIDQMISDGVNIDIFSTGNYSLTIIGNTSLLLDPYYYFYNKGYLYQLDDYLESKNGSILYNSYSQKMWEQIKLDNSIYGINTGFILNKDSTISINKSIAMQYNIDCTKFTSDITSIEDAAKTITEATENPSIELGNSLPAISDYLGYKYVCGPVVIDKKTNKAVNLFETEKFIHYITTIREYLLNGYIDPNILHTSSSAPITYNSVNAELYSEDLVTVKLYDLTVSSPRSTLCIYKNSANPTDALDLLTLLHSNTEYADSLIYGDSDTADVLFHWFTSLYLFTSVHSDEEANYREKVAAYNEKIDFDQYSTYHFNTLAVEDTLNNINQILSEYIYPVVEVNKTEKTQIYCSFLTGHAEDPIQVLDEINTKMKDAGLDTLIDAVNQSLGNN